MDLLNVSGAGRKEEERWVLEPISFAQRPLQNIALAGATGSGKTTLLKLIGGLLQPSEGTVYFNGQRVPGPGETLLPGHPSIGFLSQQYELRNHYRVADFLARFNAGSHNDLQLVAQLCRVDHLLRRWTHQLSGGERQRVALVRLLLSSPLLLLLDEPFSNLDYLHKTELKTVLASVQAELKVSAILVSHDPADTLSWAHEVLVLQNGKLVQQGTPHAVYHQSVSRYVAGLFGPFVRLTPAMAKAFDAFAEISLHDLERFVRPQEFVLTEAGQGVKTTVDAVRFLGTHCEVEATIAGEKLVVYTQRRDIERGDVVNIGLQPATVGDGISVGEGNEVKR